MTVLWTEKYRPQNISTFESLPHIKNFLNMSSPNDFPNLLLYGPPGTGKTTFAHLLASTNKLELNASDERGINVIRDKIKSYSQTLKKNKTIILDECENLTEDAQHCLRRIIEDSVNTRFIFTTNYLSKVISPLKSRLVKLKFEIRFGNTLSKIGKAENLTYDEDFCKKLFYKCNCDLRRSINVLQALAPLQSINNNTKNDLIDDIIGIIPEEIFIKFKSITKNSYNSFINDFLFEGYSVIEFIHQLSDFEIFNKEILKAKFNLLLCEIEEKLIVGCSDEITLTKVCLYKISLG